MNLVILYFETQESLSLPLPFLQTSYQTLPLPAPYNPIEVMQNLSALFIKNDMYACKSIQRPTTLHWNCEKEIQIGYPYLTRASLKKQKTMKF